MTVEARIQVLVRQWNQDTQYISGGFDKHPAHSRLIKFGEPAARWLLTELAQYEQDGKFEPGSHSKMYFNWGWFGVLRAITGAQPVADEHAGRLHEIIQDWLTWAVMNDYLV